MCVDNILAHKQNFQKAQTSPPYSIILVFKTIGQEKSILTEIQFSEWQRKGNANIL